MATLDGKKVLVITTNYGVEQDEIVVPTEQLRERGASVTVAAKETGTIQTLVGDKDPGQTLEPDTTIAGVDAKDFDALVIPGGTINADTLRQESRAATLVQAFAEASKPVAAICHGPWTLVEAGVLSGKTVTSFRRCRPTCATPEPSGSTRRSRSTAASSPPAPRTTCRRSSTRSRAPSPPEHCAAGRLAARRPRQPSATGRAVRSTAGPRVSTPSDSGSHRTPPRPRIARNAPGATSWSIQAQGFAAR